MTKKKKIIRKKYLIDIDKVQNKWTDEEVLTNLSIILSRATISTEFITSELEEGELITGEMMVAMSGDKAVFSEPRKLDWPLQRMPLPETLKGTIN